MKTVTGYNVGLICDDVSTFLSCCFACLFVLFCLFFLKFDILGLKF